jgi:Actin interacting protein 3
LLDDLLSLQAPPAPIQSPLHPVTIVRKSLPTKAASNSSDSFHGSSSSRRSTSRVSSADVRPKNSNKSKLGHPHEPLSISGLAERSKSDLPDTIGRPAAVKDNIFDLSFELFDKPLKPFLQLNPEFGLTEPPIDSKMCPLFIKHRSKTFKRSWDFANSLEKLQSFCLEEFGVAGDLYIMDDTFGKYYLLEDIHDVTPGCMLEYRGIPEENQLELENKLMPYVEKLFDMVKSKEHLLSQVYPLTDSKLYKPKAAAAIKRTKWQLGEVRTELDSVKSMVNAFVRQTAGLFECKIMGQITSTSKLDSLFSASAKLDSRFDEFQSLLDVTRKDLTRKVRLPNKLRKYLATEYESLKKENDDLSGEIRQEKVRCKQMWQKDLNHIMEQQKKMTECENCSLELAEDIDRVSECVETVSLILEYHETHHVSPVPIEICMTNVAKEKDCMMKNVLDELALSQGQDVDHDSLATLEQFNRIRQSTKQLSESKPFEDELKKKASQWNAFQEIKKIELKTDSKFRETYFEPNRETKQ